VDPKRFFADVPKYGRDETRGAKNAMLNKVPEMTIVFWVI
jgi:hypothetical protein